MKKLTTLILSLLISFSCIILAAAAGTGCELTVITAEKGNKLLIYEDDTLRYTGVSDASGRIIIKNMEEGNYKAVFQEGNYQSFKFSMPYEGQNILTAYPKPITATDTEPSSEPVSVPTSEPSSEPSLGPGSPDKPGPVHITTTKPYPGSNNPPDTTKPIDKASAIIFTSETNKHTNKYNNTDKSENKQVKERQYTIKKVWTNDKESSRPKEISVSIFINNKLYKDITIKAEDNWTATVLLKGSDIVVVENDVPKGYESFVSYSENGAVLTNKGDVKTEKQVSPPFTGSGSAFVPLLILAVAGIATVAATKKKKQLS